MTKASFVLHHMLDTPQLALDVKMLQYYTQYSFQAGACVACFLKQWSLLSDLTVVWAVQADLSNDEFSSGASSASGSGSESEAGPAEDADAGNGPAASGDKQGRAASDCPSQGSVDCSEVLRQRQPGEGTAEGDTAGSKETSSEGQRGAAVESRDNGPKQVSAGGRADDGNQAQTGAEKKRKKRHRLSKHHLGESGMHTSPQHQSSVSVRR